jgi:hypothetical protein
MTVATKVFCVRCGESLLSTFRECPSCGGTEFSETRPDKPLPAVGPPVASADPGAAKNPFGFASTLAAKPSSAPAGFPPPQPPVSPALRSPGRTVDSLIGAVPFIPRNETNIISRAERERDRIYDMLVEACAAEGVHGMVLKSHPFSPVTWVSCECWLPHERADQLRERVSAVLTIRGREYHRYEFEIDIEIKRGERTEKHESVIEFSRSHAQMLVRYLLHRVETCQFRRVDQWVNRNKPLTKTDPLGGIGFAALAFGLLMLAVWWPFGLLCLLAGIGCLIGAYHRRRRVYVLSSGKPSQEPRRLVRMDSWQTLVKDLAGDAQRVKDEVAAALLRAQPDGLRLSNEKIWYRGIDGKVEREQLVVTLRRAIAFIHIYPDGADLYVGWDAHVNGGTWVEKQVGIGRDPNTGAACQLNTIVAGWQSPNEYDVIDGNTLIERVHASVVEIVKHIMAERKIDQEIDFKILREKREGIVGHAEVGGNSGPGRTPLRRFQREA